MVSDRQYHVTVKSASGRILCNIDAKGESPQDAVVDAMTSKGFDITRRSVVKYMSKSKEVAIVSLLDGNKHSETYYNVLLK